MFAHWLTRHIGIGLQPKIGESVSVENDVLSLTLLDTSPTGHFAYWTVRLLDILPTAWTVRLPIAHFAYKTAGIKSDV